MEEEIEEEMEEKTERPKPKFKTSLKLRKIAAEMIAVHTALREITINYNKHKNKPKSKNCKKAIKAFDKRPELEDRFNHLITEHNKERFNVAYGVKLDDIERAARGEGDRNAWLKLLRWRIDYLENKQLRAIIYTAHRENDESFLKEIAHIIKKPLRPHGNINKKTFNLICKLFADGKFKKDVIQEVYNRLDKKKIDRKQLKDMGF